ncbi:MAG: type II secretion system F family protein [Candidatus Omnitrophica bacterium]|nr:type II secretion system F family protein [Candidatus Omnitrophota bacterium]
MATYSYQAKKEASKVIEGQIEALTKEEAAAKLSSLGLFPIIVEENRTAVRVPAKVKLKELIDFTQQLSTLINSGSPLLPSLNTLISSTDQVRLRPVIEDITAQIKDGSDFHSALAKYPGIFNQLYCSLVQIGEASGSLGENLTRLADFLEDELDFRSNIISVATYPLLILGVGLITIVILLQFVIPNLVSIFDEIGQSLPLPTLFLVRLSGFFSRFAFFILAGITGIFFILKSRLKKPQFRLQWDKLKLKFPLIGNLIKKVEITRFSRTLSILLRNNIPIDASLRIVTNTVSNFFIRSQIDTLESQIKEGFSLSEAMKKITVFNAAFINVITIGANSGEMDRVLANLAKDYDKQISRGIKSLMSMLEPVLILGVGAVVGFIVVSMLLPIFDIDFNF